MGTSLASIRQTLNDTAQDRQTQETIQLLYENAEKEIKEFTTDVLFTAKQHKQVEVRKQLMSFSDIKINVSKASDVGEQIGEIISSFTNGAVIQGVTKLIQGALGTILGNFSAGRSKKVFSLITLGRMGSLIRIDYLLSGYEFKGKSFTTIMKNVVVFCYIITSVNKDDIQYNDVQALIDLQYDHLMLEQKQQLCQRTMRRTFVDLSKYL